MDKKALYSISYGIFMLATEYEGKVNGCITNTCMQVANDPTRIAIACINRNYTCDLLKQSGKFTLSFLDKTAAYPLIEHFGMQSGRDVNKFENLQLPKDAEGIPYLGWQACAVISAKVVDSKDLGSHTLFIAEVTDAKVLSENEPMTYAYYQSDVKPRPAKKAEDKKVIGWRCRICKYYYEGAELPSDFTCPICGHGPEDFEPVYE